MKYIRLTNNAVVEIIPGEDPELPSVPVAERYPAKFIAALIPTEDRTDVLPGYTYDPATGAFSPPPAPPEPTLEEIAETTAAKAAEAAEAAAQAQAEADAAAAALAASSTTEPTT